MSTSKLKILTRIVWKCGRFSPEATTSFTYMFRPSWRGVLGQRKIWAEKKVRNRKKRKQRVATNKPIFFLTDHQTSQYETGDNDYYVTKN